MPINLSGFTFIKNGLTLGYPIKESVESIAPLCDEVIINVGFDDPECQKDDGTWDYLQQHFTGEKYKFIKSFWDPELTSRGLILSQQTNIALEKCTGKYCQYIQGDEALHEEDFPIIKNAIEELDLRPEVQGLIYQYRHFYGSPQILKHTRNTYRREVRLIRNDQGIKSHLDAQGFKGANGEKIKCLEIKARIFHYGWARNSALMNKKNKAFGKLYHGKDYEIEDFNYQKIWGLKPFRESHPVVMNEWIKSNQENLDILGLPLAFEWKNVGLALSDFVESLTGYRIGEYKNFKKIGSIK
ncbi:MAG: hypothetical protein K9K67_00280 [Bacteriovoracaceae bacterium]|nr:hypothetical protein [Bacteriovoracaceae bacterium]